MASCPAASTLAPPAAKGAGGGGRPRSRSRSKNSGSSNKQQQPSGDEASAIVEEWTLRLLAGVGTHTHSLLVRSVDALRVPDGPHAHPAGRVGNTELLELRFKLPRAYPSVPVEVTARLSLNEKLVAKRDKGKEKADDAASAATPTTLDQADTEAHAFAEELEEAQAQQKDEIDRSLYDNSITSLLQEQANKGTRVPLLAEMARQWYTPSVPRV